MERLVALLIGIFVLILGYPIGYFLARITSEELQSGQKWFKLIILLSLIGAIFGLIFSIDALFFSFLFFAIVTSRSLISKKQKVR